MNLLQSVIDMIAKRILATSMTFYCFSKSYGLNITIRDDTIIITEFHRFNMVNVFLIPAEPFFKLIVI